MEKLNYYTAEDLFQYRTLQIPKELFVSKYYKGLSITAIVIYGFILDRAFLSIQNGWLEDGHPFLYFTRKSFEELLGLSNKTVSKAFKELKDFRLIYEVQQGLSKPNKIFPLKYKHDTELEQYRCKNYTPRDVNSTRQDVKNLHTNNTNNNKYNRTNKKIPSFPQRTYTEEQYNMLYCNLNYDVEQ